MSLQNTSEHLKKSPGESNSMHLAKTGKPCWQLLFLSMHPPPSTSQIYRRSNTALANIFKCNLVKPRLETWSRTSLWPIHLKRKLSWLELSCYKVHSWYCSYQILWTINKMVFNLPIPSQEARHWNFSEWIDGSFKSSLGRVYRTTV